MLAVLVLAAQLGKAPPRPGPRAPLPPLPVTLFLTAKTASGEARVSAAGGKPPVGERPRVTLRAGETPQLRWAVRNADQRLPIQDLVIHFLILREESAGQAIPAGLQKGS